jgi:hypothetical protein
MLLIGFFRRWSRYISGLGDRAMTQVEEFYVSFHVAWAAQSAYISPGVAMLLAFSSLFLGFFRRWSTYVSGLGDRVMTQV